MITASKKAALVVLFALACLALAATSARAQIIDPNAISDTVKVHINGLATPLAQLDILESQEDGQFRTITVPGTIIQLLETNATGSQISDRLIIDPYQIGFASDADDPAGMIPRPNAIKVDENFRPLSVQFGSDIEGAAGNLSDFVDVIINGALAGHHIILEETAGTVEPPIDILLEPALYDLYEGTAANAVVSDYLNISQIHANFVSDSTEQGLPIIDPIPGFVLISLPEADASGLGLVHAYNISASSDGEVPEPTSLVLLGLAAMGLFGCVRRRK